MLQMGANGGTTTSNRFNATLEVDAQTPLRHRHMGALQSFCRHSDPYAVTDGWITDAPLPVRDSSGPAGAPQAFGSAQLLQSPPGVYMKADPRATRFGIFQMDTALTRRKSRIILSSWPNNDTTVTEWLRWDSGHRRGAHTLIVSPRRLLSSHIRHQWPCGRARYCYHNLR